MESISRPHCPKCKRKEVIKSGVVLQKQRWKCKACNYHFTRMIPRGEPVQKKALAVLMYSMCSASYGMIAKLLCVTRKTVYMWIKQFSAMEKEPEIKPEVKEVELDEMWHFIGSKKTNVGYGKRWTVVQ